MRARPLYLEALLVALATILLEVSYTRVFSFKLVYYFTYVIIGIALLGLGAGGVLVAVMPRLRRMAIGRAVAILALGASISVLLGYLVVATTQLNAFDLLSESPPPGMFLGEIAKLVLACFVVFVPFLCAGIALSTIFSAQTEHISRLYFADLLGAAIGCAAVIPLLTWVTPPGTVLLSGALFAAASWVKLSDRAISDLEMTASLSYALRARSVISRPCRTGRRSVLGATMAAAMA